MRKLTWLASIILFTCPAGAATHIANVPLPCDSSYQVLSPDGVQLAVRCRDHSVHVLSLPDGKEVGIIPADPRVNTFAYSRDGQWMALGFRDGAVELASAKSLAPAKRWQASERRIDGLLFFPDSKMLVVAPADSAGQVWDVAEIPKLSATLPFDFGGIAACAVSSDGKLLVVAGDDTVLRWYDTSSWQRTLENRDFLLETFALAFTPDAKEVLVGGADARITVLDAATAKPVRQLAPDAGSSVAELNVFGDQQTAAIYFDDAGEKPPHQQIWGLSDGRSVAKSNASPSCESVVGGKLWSCGVEGRTLHISQYE